MGSVQKEKNSNNHISLLAPVDVVETIMPWPTQLIYGNTYLKNWKIGPTIASKNQAIFGHFQFIYTNSGNIFCFQFILVELIYP